MIWAFSWQVGLFWLSVSLSVKQKEFAACIIKKQEARRNELDLWTDSKISNMNVFWVIFPPWIIQDTAWIL